ncbi:MAG TPA: hypothetical protein VHL77_02580, partial [Ferruginibacter sp.]|nr:hypothetical protein [Ferruginibacter sp.]
MKNSFTNLLIKSWLVWSALMVTVAAQAQTISLPAVSASITFTNPITSSNMSLVVDNTPGDEAYTEVATIAGTPCRKIPAGKFMYISCNRATIPTSQNNLLIAVTYYGNSANNIWFNYNSTSTTYAGADFQKINDGDWVTT